MKKVVLSTILLLINFGLKAQNKIESTGNVGIGTTTPIEKLHIENGIVKVRSNNNMDRFIWSRTDNTMKAGLAGDGARKMFFLADNSTIMTIDGNQRSVGIGTTNPDSKLTVAGNIHSREVKVTINAGADFVFEENYNLPSLKYIENYLIDNKHLPEIASAKEMEKNGIYLGGMNIKLLQKIEELTLYTIHQQKEIEKLKKENKELKLLSERLEIVEKLLQKEK
ncbi:hypothetical protein [Abyssalbus ytuae]|uniref:Uncharacterized protein n=1 Tax=Abyssalbus ytuae TaxID=2926907 RepID=A0A9E6ZQ95_9FLAO|nr:hypothetical protein [Abyssalbus ytuae]UOB18949.1 hypothetical protein MQE35_06550 [Abyssalbus ytuae]